MKILIIFLFNVSTFFAQNGYTYIQNAAKKIENKKYSEALYQLSIAESSDYGFCGNAWASAMGDIKILKSKAYTGQGFYDKALQELSTMTDCNFGADCQTADVLKIELLIHKYGKEKVASAFKNEKSYIRSTNDSGFIVIKLTEINETFTFFYPNEYTYNNKCCDFVKNNYPVNEFIKNYPFYKLIE